MTKTFPKPQYAFMRLFWGLVWFDFNGLVFKEMSQSSCYFVRVFRQTMTLNYVSGVSKTACKVSF